MKLDRESFLRGGETDYGIHGERFDRFRISVRWNPEREVYECYHRVFREKKDEVKFSDRDLRKVVKFACDHANSYAGSSVYDDEVEEC